VSWNEFMQDLPAALPVRTAGAQPLFDADSESDLTTGDDTDEDDEDILHYDDTDADAAAAPLIFVGGHASLTKDDPALDIKHHLSLKERSQQTSARVEAVRSHLKDMGVLPGGSSSTSAALKSAAIGADEVIPEIIRGISGKKHHSLRPIGSGGSSATAHVADSNTDSTTPDPAALLHETVSCSLALLASLDDIPAVPAPAAQVTADESSSLGTTQAIRANLQTLHAQLGAWLARSGPEPSSASVATTAPATTARGGPSTTSTVRGAGGVTNIFDMSAAASACTDGPDDAAALDASVDRIVAQVRVNP
jgi:hypothetical protein